MTRITCDEPVKNKKMTVRIVNGGREVKCYYNVTDINVAATDHVYFTNRRGERVEVCCTGGIIIIEEIDPSKSRYIDD